ncbi:MAG: hypothetical protein ABR519_09135 [Bacteroidales bacterium]
MTRNAKYIFLVALLAIMVSNSTFAETYYSKSGINPALPSGWNTAPNGTGTDAINFTTPGDIFIVQWGQTQEFRNELIIGSGVTLRLEGSIQFQRNTQDKIIINGTIIFTSNTSQIDMARGGGRADHEFTLSDGATLITSNSNGIHGVLDASVQTNSRIRVYLSTDASYEFNGGNQITNGLPSTVRNLCLSGTGTKTALASYAITRDLLIKPGATFSGAAYNYNLHGNWINNGVFSADNSTVTFSSAVSQYIRGSSATTFNNLTIAKGGTTAVFLEVNSSVEGTVTLINGYLDIADFSLYAENTSGGSSASYIRTSGTGRVKRIIAAGETKDFPVGNTAYNPAGITNDESVGEDIFNIRVTDDPITNSNDQSKTVNRRWYITKDDAGVTSITAHLTYNEGEQQAGFDSNVNPFIGAFFDTFWAYAPASVNGNTLSAGGTIPYLVDNTFLAIGSGDAFTASKFAVYVSPQNPVVGLNHSIITIYSVNSAGIPTMVTTPTNFNITSNTIFNGITSGTIPAQDLAYKIPNIQFTTVTIDATVTATRADDTGELLNSGTSALFNVVAGTTWEPVSSGNWDAVSWRSSIDGGSVWTNPASLPANNVFSETDLIYIPSGINLTANVDASFYSMIIEGSVDLTNSATLTLNHLTADDDYNVHVHGTLKNSGGTFVNSNELHPIEIHGGTYEHARDGGSIPFTEWYTLGASPSTCKVTGIAVTAITSGLDQNFQNFIWDNAGQTVTQNLHGNLIVGNELSLVNGVITTGENFVIELAAGTISRTGGYINGNFRFYVPDGTNEDIWFHIGDDISYAPVNIVFNGTTSGSGYLDAFTEAGVPPLASGLSQTRYINRKWSITAYGVNFASFSADFTYSDTDKVGSPVTEALILREFADGIWYSTNGAATGNTMSVSGLTSHGVFVTGEDDCSTGTATWFGSISTDWNTAGNWCSESVPDASTDVFIPGGIARFPVIGSAGATVKDITIDSGASLTISEACTLHVQGEWNNSGSFTPGTGTVSFTGSSLQTISGETTYYNLVINNPSGVTATGNLNVDGILSLQSTNPSAITGTLDMASYELFMGINSLTTGTGDVTGIVTRNHLFSGNTPYSFGSMFTTLRFINTGTKPSGVSCRITIGTDPGWLPVSPVVVTPVLREYSFKQSGGDDYVILQLRYLESELNGNTESDLVLWQRSFIVDSSDYDIHEHGKTASDLSDNWLELGGLQINHMAGDDLDIHSWSLAKTMSIRNRWLGGISTSWKEKGNWSEGHFPGEIRNNGGITEQFFDDNVIIQAATTYQPTLDTIARFKSIDIEAGAHLTTGQNAGNEYYNMKITGAPGVAGTWNNSGTFSPGKGKVIFDGDDINTPLTISGETDFYDLETGADTYLQPSSFTILNMYGNLYPDPLSAIDLYATDNTLNFTGSESRTLINPVGPGGERGYFNMIISNSDGEISFPIDMTIAGDFTNNISGTGSLNTTGSVVIFDDAGNNQVNYIRGTSLTSFDTIIFNNPMGIIAETDIMVNGQIELSVNNPPIHGKGALDMANGSILRMGENAVTFGIGEVTGIINRTHSFPDNIYYSFGAKNSGVTFIPVTGQTKPSSITVKITIGTAPDWSSDTDWNGNPAMSDPIYRLIELSQTGGSETRALSRIHYRDNELPPGIDENRLTIWSRIATGGTPAYFGIEEGKSGHTTSDNFITIQDVDFSFIPPTPGDFQVTIAPSNTVSSTWIGLISSDWNTGSNWNPTGVPASATSVIIQNAAITPYSPTLPVSAECKSVHIESGGLLNAAAGGGTLSLSGADLAWSVASGGTFNAGTGTVVFTSVEGTISIDGTTIFNNLTIATGSTVSVISSGQKIKGKLRVDGILNPGGNITLQSDSIQTAMIDGNGSGEVTGTIIMERYFESAYGYQYLSSPFTSATVSELGDEVDLSSSFPPVYRYEEDRPYSGWEAHSDPALILEPLKGYAVHLGSSEEKITADIEGVPNNGLLSMTLYNHDHPYTKGLNLVGNPYPSPIDWDSETGWARTNIDDAIFYFIPGSASSYSGTYSSYQNGLSSDGETSGIIPAMQGFFVHVTDGSFPVTATLEIDNNARVTSQTKSLSSSEKKGSTPLARIAAGYSDNINSFDPFVIYYDEKATSNFDGQYDALKLLNTDGSVTNFYAFSDDSTKLSINALPFEYDTLVTVRLGLKTERAGEVVFRITDLEGFYADRTIQIIDITTGQNEILKAGNDFRVNLDAGDYQNRFYLNIFDVVAGIGDIRLQGETLLNVWNSYGTIRTEILIPEGSQGVLTVVNMNGQVLLSRKVYESGIYDYSPGYKDGIYIVTLTTGTVRKSLKLFLTG